MNIYVRKCENPECYNDVSKTKHCSRECRIISIHRNNEGIKSINMSKPIKYFPSNNMFYNLENKRPNMISLTS